MIDLGEVMRTTSSGDLVYPHPYDSTQKVLISPEGLQSIDQFNGLFDLALAPVDCRRFPKFAHKPLLGIFGGGTLYTGSNSDVLRKILNQGPYRQTVAVKGFHNNLINGLEYFQAMKRLECLGVACATPLLATKEVIISKWVDGKAPSDRHLEDYYRYIWALREQTKVWVAQGIWDNSLLIDDKRNNYRVGDLSSHDIFRRFIAIDPVFSVAVTGRLAGFEE